MVKALKSFREYILQAQIIAFVPHISIKYMLCQPEADGRWDNWLTKIQIYYMVIKPTKLIKGQGLAKLMAKTNLQAALMQSKLMGKMTREQKKKYK